MTTQLQAAQVAHLPGQFVGKYKDLAVVEKPQRTAAELQQGLEERLTALLDHNSGR